MGEENKGRVNAASSQPALDNQKGVSDVLTILDSLMEVSAVSVSNSLSENTNFLVWLLSSIKKSLDF
jgi:hypothetical protein